MGYSTIIDILGSMIIGGILLLILFRTNSSAVVNTYSFSGDINAQQSLSIVVQEIDMDFKKIGYTSNVNLIPDPTKVITYADTLGIKFLSDLYNNGSVATIYYYLGPTSDMSYTPNPRDRILYRVAPDNNGIISTLKNPGVTVFKFAYYDSSGVKLSCPVTIPNKIAKIQISIKMESAEPYDSSYAGSYWTGTYRTMQNIMYR